MEDFDRLAMARLPLAEAVFSLWRHVLDEEFLDEIWQKHRGRCRTQKLTFPFLVQLIQDALLNYQSGRESFRNHQNDGTLGTSLQAAYGKLSRVPLSVSEALLSRATQRLRELFPVSTQEKTPRSLAAFALVIYDGKTIKRIAKRLKCCRGSRGGLLGGRALVAMNWSDRLVLGMKADEDGDSNDVKHTGELVPEISAQFKSPILTISDSAFCDLQQPQFWTRREGDHFLVRHHPKVKFHLDSDLVEQRCMNDEGQTVLESWGWLGSPKDQRRLRVRRIELARENDSIVLMTDLLDADCFPALDLLSAYRERWQIEQVFQKVTEVFGLSHLIGCSPSATVFQFSFCMVLYNMIQVVRAYIAEAQNLKPRTISSELLFRDVEREMIAWNLVIPTEATLEYFETQLPSPDLKTRLQQLFQTTWSETWLATPQQKVHRITPRKPAREHHSVYRLLHGKPPKRPRRNFLQC